MKIIGGRLTPPLTAVENDLQLAWQGFSENFNSINKNRKRCIFLKNTTINIYNSFLLTRQTISS